MWNFNRDKSGILNLLSAIIKFVQELVTNKM